MQKLIITERPNTFDIQEEFTRQITPLEYINSEELSKYRNCKVINLCNSYHYQSEGYYISLLAEARGHKCLPYTSTMMDIKLTNLAKDDAQDFNNLIKNMLGDYPKESRLEFNIYIGHTEDLKLSNLGQLLFNLFQMPILRATFQFKDNWQLHSLKPLNIKDLKADEIKQLEVALSLFLSGKKIVRKNYKRKKFDLAILVNPNEPSPPSNAKALQKFVKAADKVGFNTEFITKADFAKISQFDALFIRETTSVNHHKYRFSRKADYEGLVVIDDPISILRCTNKVYLSELLASNRIATP